MKNGRDVEGRTKKIKRFPLVFSHLVVPLHSFSKKNCEKKLNKVFEQKNAWDLSRGLLIVTRDFANFSNNHPSVEQTFSHSATDQTKHRSRCGSDGYEEHEMHDSHTHTHVMYGREVE